MLADGAVDSTNMGFIKLQPATTKYPSLLLTSYYCADWRTQCRGMDPRSSLQGVTRPQLSHAFCSQRVHYLPSCVSESQVKPDLRDLHRMLATKFL
jgi:hypothetical protein